jgi:hypothetical protein
LQRPSCIPTHISSWYDDALNFAHHLGCTRCNQPQPTIICCCRVAFTLLNSFTILVPIANISCCLNIYVFTFHDHCMSSSNFIYTVKCP